MSTKTQVDQLIRVTIGETVHELTRDETLKLRNALNEVVGKPPVETRIIEKEVIKEVSKGDLWRHYIQPRIPDPIPVPPYRAPYEITCSLASQIAQGDSIHAQDR